MSAPRAGLFLTDSPTYFEGLVKSVVDTYTECTGLPAPNMLFSGRPHHWLAQSIIKKSYMRSSFDHFGFHIELVRRHVPRPRVLRHPAPPVVFTPIDILALNHNFAAKRMALLDKDDYAAKKTMRRIVCENGHCKNVAHYIVTDGPVGQEHQDQPTLPRTPRMNKMVDVLIESVLSRRCSHLKTEMLNDIYLGRDTKYLGWYKAIFGTATNNMARIRESIRKLSQMGRKRKIKAISLCQSRLTNPDRITLIRYVLLLGQTNENCRKRKYSSN